MKKNLFIVLILTFFSYSSFAEIDGKGFICKCFNDNETAGMCISESTDNWASGHLPYVGFFFKDGKVEVHYPTSIRKKNKYVLSINIQRKPEEYLIYPTQIQWPKEYNLAKYRGLVYFEEGLTFLDRKSLILKNIVLFKGRKYIRKYNCNSMPEMEINNPIVGYKKFKKEMNKFRQWGEQFQDEIKKGNKF